MFDNLPISASLSLIIIGVVALTTFATRAIPFILFPAGKPIPPVIKYLGKLLTPAIIGMLVVYCLRSTNTDTIMPTIIAVITVVILHVWKRNNLLSIGVGTVLYMLMV